MKNTAQILSVFINLVTTLIEGLLGTRFILKLFGASTQSIFVKWVYETTLPLLNPFLGMFPSPKITGGFAIEFTTLVALAIYAFVGFLINQAIEAFTDGIDINNKPKTKTKTI